MSLDNILVTEIHRIIAAKTEPVLAAKDDFTMKAFKLQPRTRFFISVGASLALAALLIGEYP